MNKDCPIKSHKFLRLIHRIVSPVVHKEIKRVFERGKSIKDTSSSTRNYSRYKLNPYFSSVSRICDQLLSTLENMRLSLFLIRRYPRDEYKDTKILPHMKWVHYHYSTFVTSHVSLYDTSLLLTNLVFQLGIPESKCRNDVVRENIKIKTTQVYVALVNLDKIVSKYRQTRHAYLHRGLQPQIEEINSRYLRRVAQEMLNPKGRLDVFEPILSKRLLQQVLKKLNQDLSQLEKSICLLFDSLLPEFQKRTNRLKGGNLTKRSSPEGSLCD